MCSHGAGRDLIAEGVPQFKLLQRAFSEVQSRGTNQVRLPVVPQRGSAKGLVRVRGNLEISKPLGGQQCRDMARCRKPLHR